MLVSSLRIPIVADSTRQQRLQLKWQFYLTASSRRTRTAVSSVFSFSSYAVSLRVNTPCVCNEPTVNIKQIQYADMIAGCWWFSKPSANHPVSSTHENSSWELRLTASFRRTCAAVSSVCLDSAHIMRLRWSRLVLTGEGSFLL